MLYLFLWCLLGALIYLLAACIEDCGMPEGQPMHFFVFSLCWPLLLIMLGLDLHEKRRTK